MTAMALGSHQLPQWVFLNVLFQTKPKETFSTQKTKEEALRGNPGS